jgi:signal transduction histidine kinase
VATSNRKKSKLMIGNFCASRFLFSIFLTGCAINLVAQDAIDSLKNRLASTSGKARIEILSNLSSEYAYVNADTARKYGLQALAMLNDEPVHLRAVTLHHLAITHQVQSDYTQALAYDAEALTIAEHLRDTLFRANLLNNIGILYDEQGQYKTALDYYLQADAIYSEKKQSDKLALVKVNLGVVYKGLRDFEQSARHYRQAERQFTELGNDYGAAVCHVNMGSVFLAMHAYDSALKYSLLAEREFAKLKFVRFEAVAIGNAGVAFGHLGDEKTGMAYLQRAVDMHTQNNNVKEWSFCLQKLAELYAQQGKAAQALPLAELALAKANEARVWQQQADAHDLLARLHVRMGNYQKAYAARQAHLQVRDSLFERERMQQIRDLHVRYETAEKERALAESRVTLAERELKIRQQNSQLAAVAMALLVVVGGALLVVRYYAIRQQRLALKAALAEAKTQNALHQERIRISHELHDNIGSHLTFVNASVAALRKENDSQRLGDIQQLTADAIRELRKTVWLMHRENATAEEFVIKLRDYLPALPVPRIHVSLTGPTHQLLPSRLADQLFRFIQEGVTNAIKHAQANEIKVRLTVSEKEMTAEVTDDGHGFDSALPAVGIGLQTMRTRVESEGGSLVLSTARNSGTRITAHFPLA